LLLIGDRWRELQEIFGSSRFEDLDAGIPGKVQFHQRTAAGFPASKFRKDVHGLLTWMCNLEKQQIEVRTAGVD
jgi:hypothetical protein